MTFRNTFLVDAVDEGSSTTPRTPPQSTQRAATPLCISLNRDSSSFVSYRRPRQSPNTPRSGSGRRSGSGGNRGASRDQVSQDALNFSLSPSGEVMTYSAPPQHASTCDVAALSWSTSPSLSGAPAADRRHGSSPGASAPHGRSPTRSLRELQQQAASLRQELQRVQQQMAARTSPTMATRR